MSEEVCANQISGVFFMITHQSICALLYVIFWLNEGLQSSNIHLIHQTWLLPTSRNFQNLKLSLKRFFTDAVIIQQNVTTVLNNISADEFPNAFQALYDHSRKCVTRGGMYVENYCRLRINFLNNIQHFFYSCPGTH